MKSSNSNQFLKAKIDRIHKIKKIMDAKEKELKTIAKEYADAEKDLISVFEDMDIKTWKGKKVSVTLMEPELKAGPREGQRDAMMEWLKANNLEFIIKPAVHPSSLNMHMKARHAAGQEIPDNIFSLYFVKKLKIK